MPWVESHSPAFSARHDPPKRRGEPGAGPARAVPATRCSACSSGCRRRWRWCSTPARWRSRSPIPWLPLARSWRPPPAGATSPAGSPRARSTCSAPRRSSAAPRACRGRARPCCSRPQHEYSHLVLGANNPDLPPPIRCELPQLRALGLALRGRGHLARGPDAPSARRRSCAGCARAAGRSSPRRRPTPCCSAPRCSRCWSARRAPGPPPSWPRARSTGAARAAGGGLRPPDGGVERDWRGGAGFAARELSRGRAYSPSVFAMMFFWISEVPP